MAKSLQTLLLHAFQEIRAFLSRMRRFEFYQNKATSLLPIASPALRPKIIITRLSPLGARASSGFQSSNSAWQQDKERFLHSPTLVRSNNKLQGRVAEKGTNTNTTLSRPEICVEDWSSPEIPLSDLQDPTSGTTTLSGPGSNTNFTDKPSSVAPTSNIEKDFASEKHAEIGPIKASEGAVMNISSPIIQSPPLRAEKIRLSFEPIQRTPNAHSAVRDFFYDPPSYAAPASMVPVPLFANSPPLVSSVFFKDEGTRASLLPYPDLFDFAMYDARASQESTAGLRLSFSPVDVTITTDSPVTIGPPTISFRDRYRNSAYSRLNGLCTPARTNSISTKVAPSSDQVVPCRRKRMGGLPLASLSFNTPTPILYTSTPPPLKLRDSHSLHSSPTSSEDWNITSLDDISTRLRDACNDLSRCVWTEEEFLRIISP